MKKIEVRPSPRIFRALKRTGYNWMEAISEIVDNSADAIKKRIEEDPDPSYRGEITIYATNLNFHRGETDPAIIITDNGCGIEASKEKITGVWGLGETDKSGQSESESGVFGMGLKGASLSLANKTTISSRSSEDQKFMTSLFAAEETFDIHYGVTEHLGTPGSNPYEVKETQRLDKGTVIVLRGLTPQLPKRPSAFISSLEEHFNRIYRDDLKNGLFTIKIGQRERYRRILSKDTVIDPLFYSDEHTKFYYGDKTGKGEEIDYNGHKIEVRVSHTSLSARGRVSNLGSGCRGMRRRAVYFIRNGREIDIKRSEGRDVYWKSMPNVSNFYVEVRFRDTGNEEVPIKTDFGKKSVEQDPEFVSWMRKYLEPIVANVKKVNVSSLNKSDDEVVKDAGTKFGSIIKTPRLDPSASKSSTSDKEKEKSSTSDKEKEKPVIKQRPSLKRYRGKTDKVILDSADGIRSQYKFQIVDEYRSRDNPAWMDVDEEGFVITVNEAHSWVKRLKKSGQLDTVVQVLGAMVIALRVETKSDEQIADFTEFFGQIMNDFEDSSDVPQEGPKLVTNNS